MAPPTRCVCAGISIAVPQRRCWLELHETAIPHMVYREQGRRLRAFLSRWRERRVFNSVDGIICTVGSQRVLLDRLFPGHSAAVVLPNGVPLEAYGALPGARPDDGFVHLRYGRPAQCVEEYRDHDRGAAAPAGEGGARHRGWESGGRGTNARESHGLGSPTRRRRSTALRGIRAAGEVPRFLAGADVLLLPLGNNAQSRYFTSPMKLFEYAGSGVPIGGDPPAHDREPCRGGCARSHGGAGLGR